MILDAYLGRLRRIYDSMDRAYRERAAPYGFECTGCEDNCCRTYFSHYTVAEWLYILEGFSTLDEPLRGEVLDRALRMCQGVTGETYLCPLNMDGLCVLYPYRAMICRLHGLPYAVLRPDGRKEEGPGCDRFERAWTRKGLAYRRLDRTPFYRDLANLEWEIRQAIPSAPVIKRTVAEMLRDAEGFDTGPERFWRTYRTRAR